MKRGDVVIVDFRPHDPDAKVRPTLIVQNDRDNARMTNTIVVMFTTVTHRAAEPTQVLIDRAHADWTSSGLRVESVANCSNLFTVKDKNIHRTIGRLSAATMQQIDNCLKVALALR